MSDGPRWDGEMRAARQAMDAAGLICGIGAAQGLVRRSR